MIGAIVMGVIGVLFLIGARQRITLLHEYHWNRVKASDRRAFCALCGWGIALIGIGMILTGIILGATDSAWSFLLFLPTFAAGLAF